jgi:hypothetical protein
MLRMTQATPTQTAPDVSRLRATVAQLAADIYRGRRVGTPGGQEAARWLARQLTELGATVTTQDFPVAGVRDLYATPTLRWRDAKLVHRRDFVEHLASADLPEPRAGTVGIEPEHDQWLLTNTADPDVVAQAHTAGALGVLVPRGVDAEGWMPKMIAGPPTLELPILAVRTDLHTRIATERGEITASMPLREVEVTGTNVHAVLTDHTPSVLLTAHYDGVGDDPGQRLPAAADNASGVAVVLEAARLLIASSTGIGLAVALLDAEEAGAHGSAHHAPHVPPGTHVINIDGAADLTDPAAVEAGGPAHTLLTALDQAGRDTGVPLRAGGMASDNRRYAAGLPAIGIGMGIPGYQTPAETPDRVNSDTLVAATRLLVATVHHLAAHV